MVVSGVRSGTNRLRPFLQKHLKVNAPAFCRLNIYDEGAKILKSAQPIVYAPTFISMENGKEVGQVLGYAGEDFFGFLLRGDLKNWGTVQSPKLNCFSRNPMFTALNLLIYSEFRIRYANKLVGETDHCKVGNKHQNAVDGMLL